MENEEQDVRKDKDSECRRVNQAIVLKLLRNNKLFNGNVFNSEGSPLHILQIIQLSGCNDLGVTHHSLYR